ncbi:RES family NAD+ phosphorylase [Brucella intermedia]|uniref:RES family NAD+ phosphorylase n=1 Tax=Brucella intermedia TaxID=94625 RepID=UPI00224A89BB|nr:RES family NAD+ phosphorylase [Brucella intermedia]
MAAKRAGQRGPSGTAPLPPAWLATKPLPVDVLPAGTILHRVHRSILPPVFFGPGDGNSPINRFDSASSRFGVLYVGLSRAGALAETILRNPQRLMVAASDILSRSATELSVQRDLRIVRMHGTGLQTVGTDNAISTGPYEPCGQWTDALWDHPDQPDGLAYQSRHDPNEICIALFERSDLAMVVHQTTPLTAMPKVIAELLNRYGKSISPVV